MCQTHVVRRWVFCLCLIVTSLGAAARAAADTSPPLVERFLLDGKLADAATAARDRLKAEPADDQARFGLGVVQFLQTFEHLGGSLRKYGLRTEKAFLQPPPQVREFFSQNPSPEAITYPALREIVQTVVDDLAKVEQTLAEVKDPNVKLPLHVGQIKIDPFGQGKPVSAAFLFGRVEGVSPELVKKTEGLLIGFDRGDVNWLRGYCHFLAAVCELALALDGEHAFNCTAHLFFEKAQTPYPFLLESRRAFDENPIGNTTTIADALSFFHQLLRTSVKESARTKAALEHMEAGISQGKQMWAFILAETDDDNEWIPNPKQSGGVVGVKVTKEMVDTWLEALDDAQQVLQGKKLIPFWRGNRAAEAGGNDASRGRGVNLRRAIIESKTFDVIEWFQGTAAAPYLETGELTKFADPRKRSQINDAFGGPFNWIGFGFWFN